MNHNVMTAPVKEEALRQFLEVWNFSVQTEYVPLADCLGRVAAEDIVSVNTIPMSRISAMDGYAVKSDRFEGGIPDVSQWVLDVDFTPADTGDDFPDEYDSVIAVEQLHYDENGKLTLVPDFTFKKGGNIRPVGCIMKPGDVLVTKHTKITPELQANLAVGGIRSVPVLHRPVVAFIPTGSELTPAGLKPKRGENIECNSLLISDYLRAWGADPVCYPIVRDTPTELERTMDEALKYADIVILNGGSSKGTEDFNSRMMETRASWFLHTVKTVPGRPVGLSIIDGKPVINMPGPTMAAWVVNDWLLHSMVSHWLNVPVEKRRTVKAVLTEDFRKGPPVEVYTRVKLEKRGETYYATPIGRSARTSEMLRDGIGVLIAPVGTLGWEKGKTVDVQLTAAEECIPTAAVAEDNSAQQLPQFCDQCPNHCPTNQLKCGRGMAHLEQLKNGDIPDTGNPAADALVNCANAVKHMAGMMKAHGHDASGVLSALSAEEQETLLSLLQKQQARWNEEHAKRHGAGK